jgi:hypothetical protein
VLGEPESGTARLEEAVAAYREALREATRERVPLYWATSTGGRGIALMLIAERHGDAKKAKLAVQQIEAAFTTMRDGGDVHSAAICPRLLSEANHARTYASASNRPWAALPLPINASAGPSSQCPIWVARNCTMIYHDK